MDQLTNFPTYGQRAGRYSAARARRRGRRRRAMARMAVLAALFALASVLALCGGWALGAYSSRPGPGEKTAPETEAPAPPPDVPAVTETDDSVSPPEDVPAESQSESSACYDFGLPLGKTEPVGDEWFEDAAFLGDSRTEGLQKFSGLAHGDFLWHRGLSVFDADDGDHRVFTVDGQSATLLEALGAKEYGAVYLMLGVNELGYKPASFENGLGTLIDSIQVIQPKAVIYLQTLPPVNEAVARENGLPAYVTNENIDKFNQVIVKLAGERRVMLLDVASVYRDSDGQLPAEITSDGVHFKAAGYAVWADYLRSHTADPARYFESREQE